MQTGQTWYSRHSWEFYIRVSKQQKETVSNWVSFELLKSKRPHKLHAFSNMATPTLKSSLLSIILPFMFLWRLFSFKPPLSTLWVHRLIVIHSGYQLLPLSKFLGCEKIHDQSDSYKGKCLLGGWLTFQNFSKSWQEAWQHTQTWCWRGTGQSISESLAGIRKREGDVGPGLSIWNFKVHCKWHTASNNATLNQKKATCSNIFK